MHQMLASAKTHLNRRSRSFIIIFITTFMYCKNLNSLHFIALYLLCYIIIEYTIYIMLFVQYHEIVAWHWVDIYSLASHTFMLICFTTRNVWSTLYSDNKILESVVLNNGCIFFTSDNISSHNFFTYVNLIDKMVSKPV